MKHDGYVDHGKLDMVTTMMLILVNQVFTIE
jgi:hypothetical protein